jgi:DNA mismatch repair protein MutS
MALIADYFLKTSQYKKEYGVRTIVLMQVGAFFEVYGKQDSITKEIHGSEIMDFSQVCDLNVVEKKAHSDGMDVLMAGFKDMYVEKYVKRLQEAGYTTVVFTQDEAAKDTTRSLYAIYSPGTYFNDDASKITNNIMCVWFSVIDGSLFNKLNNKKGKSSTLVTKKTIVVGASIIDIYTGKPVMFEFSETYVNNPTTFDELERIVSIYCPSETILIGEISLKEMTDIVSYTNIRSQLIHKITIDSSSSSASSSENKDKNIVRAKNCEKQTYQKAVLEKYYSKTNADFNSFMLNFYENAIATQSFCYLLDFVYQHNPNLVNKMSEPIFENSGNRLILANHSLKQLNIIDDNNYSGKYSSIAKMLNCSCTSMGKRKFTHNLLTPTTNAPYLREEYNIIEHLLSNNFTEKYGRIKGMLIEIKDISKWMRQIIMQKIAPKSIIQLCKNLRTITNIYNQITTDQTIVDYLTRKILVPPSTSSSSSTNISSILETCETIITFITHHLDTDLCESVDSLQTFDCNFINRTIDVELDNKTQILMESNDKLVACQNYFNSLLHKYEKNTKCAEYVKIHETAGNNFTLIATKRRCVMLRSLLSTNDNTTITLHYKSSFNNENCSFEFAIAQSKIDMIECTASNDSITNAQIKDMCKNVTTIKLQLKDIIRTVYLRFIESMSAFLPQMEELVEFIATIDVIYAKAFIAKKHNYCKPSIDESANKSYVNAGALRHCLIEQLNQDELYVTNDICLGDVVDGVLLYGTNAVGKTSFIRALGISIIMAQSGFYVPASNFVFKPYQYLFTRIIGNDNIFKGLSTFAVEMSELRTILRLSNENSLILGDELCSGTESISAVSIFVAGIQNLSAKKSSFIFATHLHEIVNYDEITELSTVVLKHMEVVYDKARDMLIYDRKLKDGPGQSMYGLEVCKSLSLPEDFLTAAYNIRIKYHPECDGALSAKSSHFNAKKIKNKLCENCGKEAGAEVHHLQHQQDANEDNIICKNDSTFHKNHKANLITVCEKCHDIFHNNSTKQHKKVKTTKGMMLTEL